MDAIKKFKVGNKPELVPDEDIHSLFRVRIGFTDDYDVIIELMPATGKGMWFKYDPDEADAFADEIKKIAAAARKAKKH